MNENQSNRKKKKPSSKSNKKEKNNAKEDLDLSDMKFVTNCENK